MLLLTLPACADSVVVFHNLLFARYQPLDAMSNLTLFDRPINITIIEFGIALISENTTFLQQLCNPVKPNLWILDFDSPLTEIFEPLKSLSFLLLQWLIKGVQQVFIGLR